MKQGGLLFWSRAHSSVCAGEEVVVGGALGKRLVIGFVSTLIVFASGCGLPVEPTPCWDRRHDLPYEWSTPPESFQRELYDEFPHTSRSRRDWRH